MAEALLRSGRRARSTTPPASTTQAKERPLSVCWPCRRSKVGCDKLGVPCHRCWQTCRPCLSGREGDAEQADIATNILNRCDPAPLTETFLRVLAAAHQQQQQDEEGSPVRIDRTKALRILRAWARLSGLVGADVSHGVTAGVRMQLSITAKELRIGEEVDGGHAPASPLTDDEGEERERDDDVWGSATIEGGLEAALAASSALQACLAFRVRASYEPTTPLLVVDLVEDGEAGETQLRLAVSAAFEKRFVGLSELLDASLRRKTCPLLLLAAFFEPGDREVWCRTLVHGLFMVDAHPAAPFSGFVKAVGRRGDINLFALRSAALSPGRPLPHEHHGMHLCLDAIGPTKHCTMRPEIAPRKSMLTPHPATGANKAAPAAIHPSHHSWTTAPAAAAAADGGGLARADVPAVPTPLGLMGVPLSMPADPEVVIAPGLFCVSSENMMQLLAQHAEEKRQAGSPEPQSCSAEEEDEEEELEDGLWQQPQPQLKLKPHLTINIPCSPMSESTARGGTAGPPLSSSPLRGLSPGMRGFLQTGVVPAEADQMDDFAAVFGGDEEVREEEVQEGEGKREEENYSGQLSWEL